ncbi:MAG: hypothetical protein WBP40_01565 [Candidatus Moraniibacteriota bacterium]|nr:MAG: hypothetical protein IPJ68_03495 [Candidatus Moranbacteria bacterium]
MHWLTFALAGYFFNAVTALFDKFLLAGRIKEPVVYAFFVSVLSLFAIVLVPFGYQPIPWQTMVVFVISGVLFLYGLVAFYNAVKRSEISRVAPLVGITISIIAGVASLAFGPAATLSFSPGHLLSLLLLLTGAFFIAFDLPLKKNDALMKSTLLAGALMALSLLFLKTGYRNNVDFVNGLLWSRMGFIIGGFSLFIIPEYRRAILANTRGLSSSNRRDVTTGILFILNKIFGAAASFFLTYATFLGPVTFIQALNGVQYAFVLILAIPLAFRYPKIFGEKLYFWDWFQKGVAVILIGLGMWLAVTQGVDFLFL